MDKAMADLELPVTRARLVDFAVGGSWLVSLFEREAGHSIGLPAWTFGGAVAEETTTRGATASLRIAAGGGALFATMVARAPPSCVLAPAPGAESESESVSNGRESCCFLASASALKCSILRVGARAERLVYGVVDACKLYDTLSCVLP